MKGEGLHRAASIGIFILLAVLVFNLFTVFSFKGDLTGKLIEMKESARPAELELITIGSDCSECFETDDVISTLKGSDLKIVNEINLDSSSQDAESIIEEYDLDKLPAVILKGEIDRASVQGFEQRKDALVFTGVTPPYVDAGTGEVIGRVSAILIEDESCSVCTGFDFLLQLFRQSNIFISEEKRLDINSPEAVQTIGEYGIKKIPALLLSKDFSAYTDIAQSMENSGMEARNNYYIIESRAPYVEAETGRIRGLVRLTMISDDSCQECYNVTVHKQVLARFGIAIDEEETIDTGSPQGKTLIEKYKITKVPTIILSGDLAVYESFTSVWAQVGTVEDDGAYVFREITAMGNQTVYRDLPAG